MISEIGARDLTYAGVFIDSRTFRSFEVFLTLTVLYVLMSLAFKLNADTHSAHVVSVVAHVMKETFIALLGKPHGIVVYQLPSTLRSSPFFTPRCWPLLGRHGCVADYVCPRMAASGFAVRGNGHIWTFQSVPLLMLLFILGLGCRDSQRRYRSMVRSRYRAHAFYECLSR